MNRWGKTPQAEAMLESIKQHGWTLGMKIEKLISIVTGKALQSRHLIDSIFAITRLNILQSTKILKLFFSSILFLANSSDH